MSATIVLTEATDAVWLCPRPLELSPSRFPLIPLLPHRMALKHLPSEIWSQILEHVYASYGPEGGVSEVDAVRLRQALLLVSKDLNAAALPIFYARVYISSLRVLDRFAMRLHVADQRWDSIRRIPYSAPGRWVQTLDLEQLRCASEEDVLHLDTVLNRIFPLVPFLSELIVNAHTYLSRRALFAFTYRDGAQNLRVLKGIQLITSARTGEDTFVELLQACTRLEELEIVGSGVDPADLPAYDSHADDAATYQLHLPFLRKLVALSLPSSPALFALLHSSLPALRHLTLTPYDEDSVPCSLVPRLISAHGGKLTSLHLYTVKQWPTLLFPTPDTLLDICPSLKHLSLELPLPRLTLTRAERHELEILSIPRPKQEFWVVLERLLPKLPRLRFVRARDVKWLAEGMSSRALQTGVQGEMSLWRRKLGRRGIQLLDGEWKPGTD
ncbi:hypothetical protein K466DRAFT_501784 [Polyporus arcularius HHB13444]|uniref:F-box domain-containing protein n=1 Tax=Polyporus arcularius HHB13444 TaxID=1314778 RepID=A0A5C3NX46_9APHY|nr:hypothetical protein K466DRAFT_501784 [Polyporus arcularius HHB13444]